MTKEVVTWADRAVYAAALRDAANAVMPSNELLYLQRLRGAFVQRGVDAEVINQWYDTALGWLAGGDIEEVPEPPTFEEVRERIERPVEGAVIEPVIRR